MKPRKPPPDQNDLLRARLVEMVDMRHELVKLEALIDWGVFDREWLEFFPSHTGRPATPPRLVAGLLYLQHAYALSDEAVVARWAENPYWQHFCGETFFQHRLPIDASSMTREAGIGLRQNYNRLAPRLAGQVGRYAHARQFRRMRKALRRLKGYTGRVLRDIERQLGKVPEGAVKTRLVEMIALVSQLLAQKPKDKGKLYGLHEPAVDCISKGKAHKRYEFGTKVSVATTNRGGFVVGMRALPGNPHDGHTLHEALEQVEILTDHRPELAFVDRGYCGHGVKHVRVFMTSARRDVTRTIAKLLRRRSAIEAMIGHMKNDGRLTRCPLKGTEGDAIFAVLCGCGHNIRMILRHLRGTLRRAISLIHQACIIVDAEMAYGRRDQVKKIAA
ncbi:IS5 family transposase [uncultured Tateyamaria sp.]|uniref:IS5 family transposase n=1 Tax=uncultured Tateyamaria sp. TaxID=455651 RepID=UPI0026106050|nr:IS5 family transposase [uncultured Tateyamaria sp.]